jgi:hypothetical protein
MIVGSSTTSSVSGIENIRMALDGGWGWGGWVVGGGGGGIPGQIVKLSKEGVLIRRCNCNIRLWLGSW